MLSDTIFVQIASYRDPELQHTLQDLFKKAKYPENIFVGICHQYDMKDGTDSHLFKIPFPRQNQIRIDEVDYRKSEGVSWARDRVQKLWRGEKWTFITDSHMRFREGWDEILVNDIKKINGGKKVCFTAIPPNYDTEFDPMNLNRLTNLIRIYKSSEIGIFRASCGIENNFSNLPHGAMTYGGLFFGDAVFLKDDLFIPELLSNDDNILPKRIFTKGGDIYYYTKHVANHLWIGAEDRGKFKERANTHKNSLFSDELYLALVNVRKSANKEVLARVKKYNLSGERTLRDYERFSGINFRKKQMREYSKYGVFEEWKEVSNIGVIREFFKNKMDDYAA